MKAFNYENLIKLQDNTKVLVNVSNENLWIVCTIEKKDKEILLRDSEIDVYLTSIQDNYQDFCRVYEYTKQDEKRLVKPIAKEKVEKKEKESENQIMFLVLSITHDGIDEVFGYTDDGSIAKEKVEDLYKTKPSQYHDYMYMKINKLKKINKLNDICNKKQDNN